MSDNHSQQAARAVAKELFDKPWHLLTATEHAQCLRIVRIVKTGAPVVDDYHPVMKAIWDVRHRNACNFAPSHSGSLGEARDDTLREIAKEVKAVLENL